MRKLRMKLFAAILFLGGMTTAEAQTLRGTVTDAISGEALIGATVKVVEADKGTISDADGNFRIDIPQSGRYTINTSYIGYEPNVMKEVLVAGVKEVVVDIQLRENKSELAEVVVKPRVNKAATVNPTALIGGVMLSMEEASRYAGGYNDPARLVTAYPGISGAANSSAISVHGHAPTTMQYRLEGVQIFTPNHFNDLWEAGFGMVSALNYNGEHAQTKQGYYALKRSADNVLAVPLQWEEPEKLVPYGQEKLHEDRLLLNTELSKQVTPAWLMQVGADYSHRFFRLNCSANVAAGILDDNPIYKDDETFSQRFDPTGIIDLTVSYKINRRKVSHTIAFEGLNILGTKTPMFQRFDLGTLDVRTDDGGISLPNIFYRLDF